MNIDHARAHNHIVLFSPGDRTLGDAVAGYLADGLAQDETALVIATPEHRRLFERELGDRGVDVRAAAAERRLLMLDAEESTALFMTDHGPVWPRFEQAIDGALARLAPSGRGVRAYGEMVDLLWMRGRKAHAIELEQLWTRLLETRRACLFCAYTLDLLDSSASPAGLDEILAAHSHVVSSAGPELDAAVDDAVREAVGDEEFAALRALIQVSLRPGPAMSWGERALLWARANLAPHSDRIVERVRRRLQEQAVA